MIKGRIFVVTLALDSGATWGYTARKQAADGRIYSPSVALFNRKT